MFGHAWFKKMTSFSWLLDLAGVIQRSILKQTKRNHFFNWDLQVPAISIELGVEVEVTISDV